MANELKSGFLLLTLDTNVVRDYIESRGVDGEFRVHVEKLLNLSTSGKVSIAVTRYIDTDIPNDPLRKELAQLPILDIQKTPGVITLDQSPLDGPDGLGSGEFQEILNDIYANFKAGDRKLPVAPDFEHLHAHFVQGRDVFLTRDKSLIFYSHRFERLGILAMEPDEFLKSFEGVNGSVNG